jgi:lipopolysaccharide/colanic/teichoic acid biosynthesis glycosyltransferase
MKLKKYIKYAIRFLFLQSLLTYLTIFYFDKYLLPQGEFKNQYRIQIDKNLLEDKNRFLSFISDDLVKIDIILAIFIFIFLVVLFSTKFYTYVNELSFSLDSNYLGEYFSIYLVWTSSIMIFTTLFRFSNLISRSYLILYTIFIPLVLLVFRNTEILSSIFGRAVTNESFITINLEEDSAFRKLRLLTFRRSIGSFKILDLNNGSEVIRLIDSTNKEHAVNLIFINLGELNKIDSTLEEYLINLNKKVVILSKNKLNFKNLFINREQVLNNYYLTYFNNDIQYGAKFIIKRILDIFLSSTFILFFLPIYFFISLFILFLDGYPFIVKQNRVGLHGKKFTMYKFRTMYKNSHQLREQLSEQNKRSGPLFKLDEDPRIIKGSEFLRSLSLDELPQMINVLKGDMSLVGPRPLFEEDTKLFEEKYMRRLNVLPGITGLLQINERNTNEFSVWYKYDVEYIENWSIFLDLSIIFKTPFSIFKTKIKGK